MEKIKDKKPEIITLPMIFNLISEQGKKLSWSILDLNVIGDLGEDKPVPEFQASIFNSPQGYPLEWDELCDMAAKFEQVIGCLLIACKDKKTILGFTEESLSKGIVPVVSEVLIFIEDSQIFALEGKNEKIIESIHKRFGPLPIGLY